MRTQRNDTDYQPGTQQRQAKLSASESPAGLRLPWLQAHLNQQAWASSQLQGLDLFQSSAPLLRGTLTSELYYANSITGCP